jgi:pimeloyl-ACP methyl ester carboxylesterase
MPRSARAAVALLAVGLVAAMAAVAPSAGATSPAASVAGSASTSAVQKPIVWKQCVGRAATFRCGSIRVPLDYSKPTGKQISVRVARYRAPNQRDRKGSILFNPGGPGASGVDYLFQNSQYSVPANLADRFDVVSWDPRGTGGTIPVKCNLQLDFLFNGIDYTPETPDETSALEAVNANFAQQCGTDSGDRELEHVGSLDTVRDLDQVRAALGEPKLRYVGYSYGTYYGALYAREFPNRVGQLILDGVVDPALDTAGLVRAQAKGFEDAFNAFLADCAQKPSCAFHSNGDPAAAYDGLVARIDANPIPAGDGRALGASQFDIGITWLLYGGELAWGDIATALRSASRGDGRAIYDQFEGYTGRSGGATGNYDGEYQAYLAISCVDLPPVGDTSATMALADSLRRTYPRFGASVATEGLPCATWPVPPVGKAGPIHAPKSPPLLLTSMSGDPATPLVGAQALRKELANRSRLVVVPGEMHTATEAGGACLDAIVRNYMLEGKLPKPTRTDCPAAGT